MNLSTVQEELVLGLDLAGTFMTPEEFDAAVDWDENYCYELINGVLVVMTPPSPGELGPNDWLGHVLRSYQENHPQGSALSYTVPEFTLTIGSQRRRADRAVWAGLGRLPNVREEQPAIAIEFVSSRRRDRLRDYESKRDEYESVGIQEYWIIDRFRRRMTVIRFAGGKRAEIIVEEGQAYTTDLLPGFELPVSRLLAEADMIEQAGSEE